MDKDIVIEKLREAKLYGKGGACFPTADKWQGVSEAEGDIKYIIVNSSEGEMGLFKDLYIWRNHMDMVFKGIDYAINFLDRNVEVYLHINRDYLNELQPKLFEYINNYKWDIKFHINIEEPSYIGGEASALMNIIETGVAQPKPRTTRTVVKGLFEKPTMMNNVETFYDIARTLDGNWDFSRFTGIFGDGLTSCFGNTKKVVRHKDTDTIYDVLKNNNLLPDFDFYVQVGGGASGIVYNSEQIKEKQVSGAGSIEIFDKNKRNFLTFLQRITKFYDKESCGKCMGKKFSNELYELVKTFETEDNALKNIDKMLEIINNMNKKTFCKLCKSLKTPFVSYCSNILNINLE